MSIEERTIDWGEFFLSDNPVITSEHYVEASKYSW